MEEETIIIVENLCKDFILPHERTNSLKSGFLQMLRGNKEYEKQHALKNVSFTVRRGQFFGIVGRNGSGKSTLLKLLAGIYQPTSGSVVVKGRIVPFIELGVGFNGELTGRENVFLNGAMLGYAVDRIVEKYQDIVDFAELEKFMDQKLKNYSSGMQVRLAFSVATRLAESDVLLIDEVLAVGDAAFQRKCYHYFRQLKKQGKTVIFVTHDMDAVREYCDDAVLIEGGVVAKAGSPEIIANAYAKMFSLEASNEMDEGTSENRWGSKDIEFEAIQVDPAKLLEEEYVTIRSKFVVNKKAVEPIFGFSIKNAMGTTLLGTNSKIKRHSIGTYEPGDRGIIEWRVPNILGDGEYTVNIAVGHHDGVKVFNWWEDAKGFKVIRDEKTPYIVEPPISVTVESDK